MPSAALSRNGGQELAEARRDRHQVIHPGGTPPLGQVVSSWLACGAG